MYKTSSNSESSGSSADSIRDIFEATNTANVDLPVTYDHRFRDYHTGDVLVIDDDSTSRTIICRYLSKIVLKRDSEDPGRRLHVTTCTNGNDAIKRLTIDKETYACVMIDNFLGPNSPSGREIVRKARETGYEGAIVYVSCVPETYKSHLLEVGGDGILFKGMNNLGSEMRRIITELAIRNKSF